METGKASSLRFSGKTLLWFPASPAQSSGGERPLQSQSSFSATGTHPALGSGDGAAGKDDLQSQAPLFRPIQTCTQVSLPVLNLGLMVTVRLAFLTGLEIHGHFFVTFS